MIVTESLLLTVLFVLLFYSAFTDYRQGIIKNQVVIIGAIAAGLLDAIYYTVWQRAYLYLFFGNVIFLGIIAFLFYAYHLWAAGDSKLLFVVGLLVPANLYEGMFSCFIILILVFSGAFVYVVGETLLLSIKQRSLFQKPFVQIDYAQFFFSYMFMAGAVVMCNWLLTHCLHYLEWGSSTVFTAIDFIVVLTLIQIRNRFSKKILGITAICIAVAILVLSALTDLNICTSINVFSCVLVIGLILVRSAAERYNYQMIPTSEVKKGQILSAATVVSFSKSRVQGLPHNMTEDLRARLTEQEADSVRRWEKSKYGKPYVMIVRKIPFAIFIALGTIMFLMIRIL